MFYYGLLHKDTPESADQQKINICLLCANTGRLLGDLPRSTAGRDRWWEGVNGICIVSILGWCLIYIIDSYC